MKSNILDFSVGNCEKVLLLFTRLPGELYFILEGSSAILMVEELEEELNSLLKLQVASAQKAEGDTKQTGVRGKSKVGGHQPDSKGAPTFTEPQQTREHATSCNSTLSNTYFSQTKTTDLKSFLTVENQLNASLI